MNKPFEVRGEDGSYTRSNLPVEGPTLPEDRLEITHPPEPRSQSRAALSLALQAGGNDKTPEEILAILDQPRFEGSGVILDLDGPDATVTLIVKSDLDQ